MTLDSLDEQSSERFWSKVDRSEDCWIWTGAKSRGYGYFGLRGKWRPAYRVAYASTVGPIPDGMHIDHMCHTPACVNPAHLRPVTNKENHENLRGAHRNSKSGLRGVFWNRRLRKWVAQVTHNYKTQHLGLFDTAEEADAVARAARARLFTHSDADMVGDSVEPR